MPFDDNARVAAMERYELDSEAVVKKSCVHVLETTDEPVVRAVSASPLRDQPLQCHHQGRLTYVSARHLNCSSNFPNNSTEAAMSHTTSVDDIPPRDVPHPSWSAIGLGAPEQYRTPLNTRARPFVSLEPHSGTSGPESLPPKATINACAFNRHVLAVAAEVEATMRCSGVISDVEVNRVRDGWGLVAQMRSGSVRQQVLEAGKQSVIKVVERLRCARFICSHGNAFTESVEGFSMVLGSVEDEASACWDSYACGRCPREGHCPWQHPTCQGNFVFAVTSEDPS